MAKDNEFLTAALEYAERGWRVLPARPRGKAPLIKGWPVKATTDPNTIKEWWERWPSANVAIATGNGLIVLDVDFDMGGACSMREIREKYSFPTTPTVETPGPGCHHYLQNTRDEIGNKVDFMPGLDLRGAGGYVIAPPSTHPNGGIYQWSIKP